MDCVSFLWFYAALLLRLPERCDKFPFYLYLSGEQVHADVGVCGHHTGAHAGVHSWLNKEQHLMGGPVISK